jgi:AcrR family transcriptional regulator
VPEALQWPLDKLNERSFNPDMGRVAGVTPADTRERLLRAAADVFAERGFDGTRVADIAAAAGVSNGALYAHFGSKAELLLAALRAHGPSVLARLLAADPDRSITETLLLIGRGLTRRPGVSGNLIVEALVAARRDEEVARLMHGDTAERAGWLGGLVRAAQEAGDIDPELSPDALAHFCMLLAVGSSLLTADLHTVCEEEWATLLARVVGSLAPAQVAVRPRALQ